MRGRPNILWYCTDQQRFDTLGFLGNAHVRTPRLDEFARSAVAFSRAYSQSPVCTPSRASFLTGMYPSALAVNGNGVPCFPDHFADRLITKRLADAGYECGLVGKLHIASAYGGRERRTDDGYRRIFYSHAPKGPDLPGHDYAEWLREHGVDPAEVLAPSVAKSEYRSGDRLDRFSGLLIPTRERDNVPPQLHQSKWCTQMARRFLSERSEPSSPWLLSVNPFDPHPPFDAPYEYYRRYDPASLPGARFRESDLTFQRRLASSGVDFQSAAAEPGSFSHREMQASYYAMIELLDHEFGRLLDELDERGERENTIVIYMSDHGEALGDHGLRLKGCRFYEGSVRVPLLVSWPASIDGGRRYDGLVELTDLVPTLYELLGLETPYSVQGRSIAAALVHAATTDAPPRTSVRAEAYDAIDYPNGTCATMFRDERFKLVIYHGLDVSELYDLDVDPWEHDDLSREPDYASILTDLTRRSFDATVAARSPQEPRIAPY